MTASTDAPAAHPAPLRIPAEDPALRYSRQTRNAVVTLATIAVIGVLGSIIIIGIVVAVSIAHQNAVLDGGSPSVSSTCASQGGWDPTC